MERIETDVWIIGAGAAGIRAALSASKEGARVILATREGVAATGSTFSPISKGWGIQALLAEERTAERLECFHDDIMEAGLGKCSSSLVRILVEESGPRIEDLISYGLRFRKNEDGDYVRVKGCFSGHKRALITESMDSIKACFRSMIVESGAGVIQGRVIRLDIHDGACWGGWLLTRDAELVSISAGATVLATGGAAGIFSNHFVTDDDTGDGYVLAHEAGAEINNLAFIQFMLGFRSGNTREFLPLPQLRHRGSLVDETGRDILSESLPAAVDHAGAVENRKKHFPFSCRDMSFLIDRSIFQYQHQGIPVLWVGQPGPHETEPATVIHLAHAYNGGVKIDEQAQSSVEGLFAAGETAAGPHGADRIGGCMMTATQVFGNRAGVFGARLAQRRRARRKPPARKFCGVLPDARIHDDAVNGLARDMERRVRDALTRHASVVRSAEGLQQCMGTILDCLRQLHEAASQGKLPAERYWQLKFLMESARLVVADSMQRAYSLGAHFREDFPPTIISS